MTHKQRYRQEERLRAPPSPPPRNPFAHAAKMRRGVEVHEKSRGAQRREMHIRLACALRGDFSKVED
ncbi:MAG: hypothetical protein LBI59_11685 [Candidatus Accumulibacter sp.]|jgi:hypothetical protein|nr:hypothetical protein [Accumulibacter sp.]